MFLKLGTVGRALGLQGSFYISGRDEPIPAAVAIIKIGNKLEIAKDAEIIAMSWQNDRAVIRCSLAGDRTSAELLRGMAIWAEAAKISVDDSKEFLLKDLVGRSVIDVDGNIMGTVQDVVRMPASVNLVVLRPDASANVDIPMISDYVEMNFERGSNVLRLTVPADTFDEIWNPRKKK